MEKELMEIKILLTELVVNQKHFLQRFEEHVKDDEAMAVKVEALNQKYIWTTGVLAACAFVWTIMSSKVLTLLGLR